METLKVIISFCISILNFRFPILGHNVSFMNVAVFSSVGLFVLVFLRRIFK